MRTTLALDGDIFAFARAQAQRERISIGAAISRLAREAHVHHVQALEFMHRRKVKIATCPSVENGIVRILNLPGYSKYGPVGFEEVRSKLHEICDETDHEFWPDSISLRTDGLVNWSRVLGHNQITDVYLLALALANQGALVTLDHRVALSTVTGSEAGNSLLL